MITFLSFNEHYLNACNTRAKPTALHAPSILQYVGFEELFFLYRISKI